MAAAEFVVVANRLPVDRVVGPDGEETWRTSPGGLVAALEPMMRRTNGAWVGSGEGDPTQVKTIEDLALYAHGTGALPPGVEGGLDAQTVYRD